MSTVVTLRVPKKLKETMKKFAARADWPAYLRSAIQQKVAQLELEEASQASDRIRAKTSPGVYDSTKTLRSDRKR